MSLEIKHDEDDNKFYTIVDGSEAYLRYIMDDYNTMEIIQTYVPNELRDRGIAGKIVRKCLSFAEEKKLRIIPTCSYTAAFIKRHKEFENLLA
ncbi:MAG: GNAT family N-acetyltransferase [Ignavibacteriaceae bacterium]|jgi:predicted GNAT family acetyltransferase